MREGTLPLLSLREVVKHYRGAPEPVRAVDGVTLEVAEGEMIALHGPSGSGKTTLLLLIANLLVPDAGEIRFRDETLGAMSEARASEYLRRDVGFIHQGAQLMPHVSALENAAVKLLLDGVGAGKARRRARPWLERLGLGERVEHTPEQLSGGERQRVSIARALAGEPALILADEPTGNLDTRRSVETVALLREIAHEHTRSVLLVTHDREAAALADHVYGLRDGRLAQALPEAHMPFSERPRTTAEDLARAGVRDAEVEIVDYDPAWPAAFLAEQQRLAPLLDGADIHHFGSTAVPGLAAKPVIDMIALVDDLDAPIAALVQSAGYEFPRVFNATLAHRRFFCYPTASYRTHHLHLVDEREEIERRLRFRDRLRSDPILAEEYVKLKRALAERYRDDREAYTEAKSEFVRLHDRPTAPRHAAHDPA